jgi:hypothetical protein
MACGPVSAGDLRILPPIPDECGPGSAVQVVFCATPDNYLPRAMARRERRTVKKIALLSVALAGAAATTLGLGLTPAAPTASAAPCGFYVDHNTAFYNHCGSAPTITIAVRYAFTSRGDDRCVGRGITRLERQDRPADRVITNAWYLRNGC